MKPRGGQMKFLNLRKTASDHTRAIRVIEITPKRIAKYIPCGQIDILDVSKESAYRGDIIIWKTYPAYSG